MTETRVSLEGEARLNILGDNFFLIYYLIRVHPFYILVLRSD